MLKIQTYRPLLHSVLFYQRLKESDSKNQLVFLKFFFKMCFIQKVGDQNENLNSQEHVAERPIDFISIVAWWARWA